MAETVAVQMTQRSLTGHEVISLDLESGGVGPRRIQPPTQFPIFITLVSLLQVTLFYVCSDYFFLLLAFDPYRRYELWRYLTMMLVHGSWIHLWSNTVLQVILGFILEEVHHWRRISVVYICGIIGGSLAISVFSPQNYTLGASAGVYALLFAHLATIIMNWNEMHKKCCRLFWLLLYIFLDVGLALYNELVLEKNTDVSHAGHFGGAVVGFIVAVLVLRNFEKHPWERRLQAILGVLIAVLFAVVVFINLEWPSHYKKTEWNTNYRVTFLRHFLQMIDASDLRRLQLCFQDEKCRTLLMKIVHADYANKTGGAFYRLY